MSAADIQAEIEVEDFENMAPPTVPEHGAAAAHNAFTVDAAPGPTESAEPATDPEIERQLALLAKQRQQLMTTQMAADEGALILARKKIEQDNLLKQLILQKNQNQVMNVNPFITQSQDIATAQRRFIEAQKYKQDEFTRAEQVSQIGNEEQYLTRQTYANYLWGIPSVQGLENQGEEYFAI